MKKSCCEFNFTETEKGFAFEFNSAKLKERCKSWFDSCCKPSTGKEDSKASSCCKESPQEKR